jgi:hypothetical protein
MQWTAHIACMLKMKDEYKIVIGTQTAEPTCGIQAYM